MESGSSPSRLYGSLLSFMRKCIFRVLSMGPIPRHISFIMDGNRRFAKKENLEAGAGYRVGFSALMRMLKYCYELGIKYVSIYAFSIDNFKRRPDEVQNLMDLMLEKVEGLLKEESILNEYGVGVYFLGNLKLLSEPVRVAAEKVMRATGKNTKCLLLICIAYTSSNETLHAVQESCKDKYYKLEPSNSDKPCNGGIEEVEDGKKIDNAIMHVVQESSKDEANKSRVMKGMPVHNGLIVNASKGISRDKWNKAQALEATRTCNSVIEESEKTLSHFSIKLVDIEKHMYMAVAPDPDILIRASGETRLSNFLLWQTGCCQLYSPQALWPEISLWQLVWAILNFQRNHSYLEKKKKQL